MSNIDLFSDATVIDPNNYWPEGKIVEKLSDRIDILAFSGHSTVDLAVTIRQRDLLTGCTRVVSVAGDLFESEDDLVKEELWKDISIDTEKQLIARRHLLDVSDIIVPGHGRAFRVGRRPMVSIVCLQTFLA